jgi:hypothetical protein
LGRHPAELHIFNSQAIELTWFFKKCSILWQFAI